MQQSKKAVNPNSNNPVAESGKAPTGIQAFDELTGGGLPRGKITLVTGGPATGKTVFGLQNLVNAALIWDEPGIFVTFEENARQLIAGAARFGWNIPELEKLFFLDAMPDPDVISVGEFDLSGMLTLLSAKIEAMKARRIVFDSLDALLRWLPGRAENRREIDLLYGWLVASNLTAIIIAKLGSRSADALPSTKDCLEWMPFPVECVVVLTHPFTWSVNP
jgi:circadian clock protein KaiC